MTKLLPKTHHFAKYLPAGKASKILNTKYISKSASIAFVLLVIIGVTTRLWPQSASAAWFDENFLYRTALTISNSGSADANKKVKFDIDTATLITAGKMQSSCADTRFTDVNGTQLKFFLDTAGGACNTNSTDYYVLVPVINAGSTIIYHYYGNPSAVSTSQLTQFSEATFSPTGTSAASEEKAPQPVAYWKFDEGTGTTTKDSTTNKNTATLTNMSSTPATNSGWMSEDMCISGKCLGFDGGNDYVEMGNPTDLSFGTSNFSFGAWIRTNTTTRRSVMQKYNYSLSPEAGYVLDVLANGKARAIIETTSSQYYYKDTTVLVNDNKWHHLMVVRTGSTMNIYVDGVLDTSSASVQGTVGSTDSSSNFRVGYPSYSGSDYFRGFIDEPKVYPYARTAAQIKTDYASRGSTLGASVSSLGANQGSTLSNGLVGYWKMDESSWNGTSGEVKDASGNGNNGTGVGSVSTSTGKFGNSGYFDGVNDYVSTPTSMGSAFTISLWYKQTAFLSNPSAFGKVLFGNNSNNCDIYDMGTGVAFYATSGAGVMANSQSTTTGAWNHVVVTVNGTNGAMYVNGVLTSSSTTVSPTCTNKYIGGGQASRWFNGYIDETRIYNRALSAFEVSTLYTFAPGPIGYWNLEEGSGATINNKGLYADSVAFSNTPKWIPGKVGKGLNIPLNASGYSAGVSTGSNYINSTTQSFTFETYVNLTNGSVNGSYWYDTYFISRLGATNSGGCSTQAGLAVQYRSLSDARIYFTLPYQSSGSTCNQSTQLGKSNTVQFRKWYHVAGTFDGSSKLMSLYIDGRLVESATWGGSGDWTWNSSNLTIGNSSAASDYSLDELKVYNYVRSAKQITEDMMSDHPAVSGARTGSMVGYWKMDEGNGTSLKDSSGNGNNGTLTNMATAPSTSTSGWSNFGKFNKALNFDGSDDYIDRATTSSLEIASDTITLSAWIKPTTWNTNDYIVAKYAGGSDGYGMGLTAESSTQDLKAFIYAGGSTIIVYADLPSRPTGSWHHMSAKYDGKNIAIYWDGVLINQSAKTGNITPGSGNLTIGRLPTVASSFFDGQIDDVKIYNYPLTLDDIKKDYNRGASQQFGSTGTTAAGLNDNSSERSYCPPGDSTANCSPVGEWSFEDGQGATIRDTSANGLDGTATSTSFVSGKVGKGLQFTGNDSYVNVGTSALLNITGTKAIEAWVKIDSSDTTNSYRRIFSKREGIGSTATTGYELLINPSTCVVLFQHVSINPNATATATGCRGNWVHIAGVYTGTQGIVYINGVAGTPSTFAVALSNSNPALIGTCGSEYNDGVSGCDFKGQIDQVKVYNYTRTGSQIAWDYNRGAPIAQYKMDECQGLAVQDSSGNGNTGTITIGASGTQTSVGTCQTSSTAWGNGAVGKINSSLKVDGTDDYVGLPGSIMPTGAAARSMSLWVKTTIPSTRQELVYSGTETTNGRFVIEIESSKFKFNYYSAALAGTTTLLANTWYHVLVTYDGTTIRLYVNGVLESSVAVSLTTGTTTTGYLGAFFNGSFPLNGQMDDVKIYNYALTNTQIKDVYNGGAVRIAPVTGTP